MPIDARANLGVELLICVGSGACQKRDIRVTCDVSALFSCAPPRFVVLVHKDFSFCKLHGKLGTYADRYTGKPSVGTVDVCGIGSIPTT